MNDEMSLWAELMNSDDFNDLRNQLLIGDCLEQLDKIEDGSVNLIMTSPPYAERRKQTYGGIAADKYVDWFMPIANKLQRVLAADGSFVLNIKEHTENKERSTYVYELVIALNNSGWKWIDDYIWYKLAVPPGNRGCRLKDKWEHCFHFGLDTTVKINKNAVKVPSKMSKQERDKKLISLPTTDVRERSKNGSGFQLLNKSMIREMVDPGNVLEIPTEPTNRGHSAVFHPNLPEFFIKLLTDPEDIVLDPFAGSGTTLMVAKQNYRDWIGIEICQEYQEVINKRIGSVQKALQTEIFEI